MPYSRCHSSTEIIDVTNQKAMANWIKHINNVSGLDLVIANAGISGEGRKSKVERNKDIREIFAVNISGVLNTTPAVSIINTRPWSVSPLEFDGWI